MSEIADVVSGETIESAWGNAIRDRTVQRYSTPTQRDTLHPSPVEGDLAFIESTDVVEFYDGSAWQTLSRDTPQFARGSATLTGNPGTAYADDFGDPGAGGAGDLGAVTVDSSSSLVLVRVMAQGITGDTTTATFYLSHRVSGASTIVAADIRAASWRGSATTERSPLFMETLQTVNPGVNTFTLQAKSSSGTPEWILRYPSILVQPV